MTLATDQLTAKRWFQWEIEGRSWEKNSGVSTVQVLDTRRQIVGVKRYVYDARRNITHRYVKHNQCNKCWLHMVKAK
jgi:flagellar biosynthesis chaperone FliJ